MGELDHKEGWVQNNWWFQIVVLRRYNPKGDQSWVFIGRTDVEAETPILCPPDVKSWLFEKTLMVRKIEGRRRRGRQRMRWLDGITNSMDMSWSKLWRWWWTGMPGVLQSMGLQRVGHEWVTELNWTEPPPPPPPSPPPLLSSAL